MTTTTKLALELLANSAANQTLANTTFAQLNQLVQAGVVDRLTTPPGSPADEALYIITATATGAWAGKENQLAYWLTSTSAWQYITPREGMLVHVNDEDVYYKYTGSAWAVYTAPSTTPQGFNAKPNAVQSIPAATFTKVLFQTEAYDTGGSYDATTSTFTPTVAGKYLICSCVGVSHIAADVGKRLITGIYKNGVIAGSNAASMNNTVTSSAPLSMIFDMNGSTDYIEIFFRHDLAAAANTSVDPTFFSAQYLGA